MQIDWEILADIKWLSLGVAILGIVISLFLGVLKVLKAFREKKRTSAKYFKIRWRKANRITPEEIMDLRGRKEGGYCDYYSPTDEYRAIEEAIRAGKNILMVGKPLAGKTRAVYQAVKSIKPRRDILMPNMVEIEAKDFKIPLHLKFWRGRTLLIDDLDRFCRNKGFEYLIEEAGKKRIPVVATCRSGEELEVTTKVMAARRIYIEETFKSEDQIRLKDITKSTAQKIAHRIERDWSSVSFDGSVGSIFLPLAEMKARFDSSSEEERAVLLLVKDMYDCGMCAGSLAFPIEWVRNAVSRQGVKLEEYEWENMWSGLASKDLLVKEKDYLTVEQAYLDSVIVRPVERDILDKYESLTRFFMGDPKALQELGDGAYWKSQFGRDSLRRAELISASLKAYDDSLRIFLKKGDREGAAGVEVSKGNAYSIVAEVEDRAENCKLAVECYQKALQVFTLDDFPTDYAGTQNNLGNAYGTLAVVEQKGDNCRMAIGAYEESLKVWTLERFPIDYAMIQSNLGNVYGILAGLEHKGDNCRLAILACKEALHVRTLELFPIQYALTQHNLGNAYCKLAEVGGEHKGENCHLAIRAYNEALKVRTLERFPIDYAQTQNSLGATYQTLAHVENTMDNCNLAIGAYEEALQVRTIERFPMDYATTQNNLGNVYGTLARVEEKIRNCRLALDAYQEALYVFKKEKIYLSIQLVERNIELLKGFCKDYLAFYQ